MTIQELYIDKKFGTFDQIKRKYGLPSSDFFRYLQIRDFARKHFPNFERINTHSYMESINKRSLIDRGSISFYYSILTKAEGGHGQD